MTAIAIGEVRQARTVGEVLAANRGLAPGFDAMRLVLAVAVLVWHSLVVTAPREVHLGFIGGPWAGLVLGILPMFFCLSGFLVTGSLDRVKSVKIFLLHRVLRIGPALAVEVLLSALILGPMVTSLALSDYFTRKQFFAYLGNTVGRIRLDLPGVFEGMPAAGRMNLSLWTVPYELDCYVLLTALIVTGLVKRRGLMLWITAGFVALKLVVPFLIPASAKLAEYALEKAGNPYSGYVLVLSFLVGVVASLWRDRIPLNGWLAAACVAVFAVLSYFKTGAAFVPLILGYATIYLGMVKVPKLPFFSTGDYSYGIYLYAFPIQQSVAYFLPWARVWWVDSLIALPLVTLMAWGSWHLVEKHVLSLRKRFK